MEGRIIGAALGQRLEQLNNFEEVTRPLKTYLVSEENFGHA